jgi:hypothetical protein
VRKGGGVCQQHLDRPLREGPREGGEILGFVLESADHPRRDVESEVKIEVKKAMLLSTLKAKSKGTKDILI